MELVELLDHVLLQVTFRTEDGKELSVEEFRGSLSDPYWGKPIRMQALRARPEVADDIVSPLETALQNLLSGFINASTGELGHSFSVGGEDGICITATGGYVPKFQSKSDVKRFARALVRAAAILGSEPAGQMVEAWANGEPFQCKVCFVLSGIYVAEPIELDAGLRVSPMPVSSVDLPLSMPNISTDRLQGMLGHTLMEVDAQFEPAFFLPGEAGGKYPETAMVTIFQAVMNKSFFNALSLVCNGRAEVMWFWADYGDAVAFAPYGLGGSMPNNMQGSGPSKPWILGRGTVFFHDTNIVALREVELPCPNLELEFLYRTRDIVEELERRMREGSRFRIAIERWEKAADLNARYEDRVIDLRIALEALYIGSDTGELRFRLATTCARHLGDSLEERRKINQTVKGFYSLASKVIHAGRATVDSEKNRKLFEEAIRLCCKGILKVVETKTLPKWEDVILE